MCYFLVSALSQSLVAMSEDRVFWLAGESSVTCTWQDSL